MIAVECSENQKTGPISVTYVAQGSCPPCPFRDNGCYAELGHTGLHTDALNRAGVTDPVTLARLEAEAIDDLTGRRPLRLHVVGDCATDEAARIVAAAAARYTARWGQPVFTYTHGWRVVDRASWGDIHVLASCEDPADVPLAHARGYATALVYDTGTGVPEAKPFVHHGQLVMPCPEQSVPGKDCAGCLLCAKAPALLRKGVTIGFYPHGCRKKRVRALVQEVRDAVYRAV